MSAGDAAGQLVARLTHARDVPSAERVRFAAAARAWALDHRGFVLETCHRVEAYGVADPPVVALDLRLPPGGRALASGAVVRHAITVAVGLDSVVVGEDQVLHQLRAALGAARDGVAPAPVLDRLFTVALRAGRRARSWRQGPPLSLADLALATLEGRAGPLRDRHLLVVGAGPMGALAVRAGLATGAVVTVASRDPDRAAALAQRFGVATSPLDPGAGVREQAGVVVALGGPWALAPSTAAALGESSVVVVDLSVPAALSDGLSGRLDGRVISADDLARLGDRGDDAPGHGEVARLEALVAATAAEFEAWLAGHDRRAAAQALADHAESERLAELATLWRQLPPLDAEARQLIDGMSRHLAARLLREPLARLGRDRDGRHERAVRELFDL